MSTPLTVEGTIHFARQGARKELRVGPAPVAPEPGRVPRVPRLMALAIRFDRLVRDGAVADFAELARLGRVTQARMSQIMSLIHLAPDIQEAILFLPRTVCGRDAVILRDLLPIVMVADWRKQRRMWTGIASSWSRIEGK